MTDPSRTRRLSVPALDPVKKQLRSVTVSNTRLKACRRSLGQVKEAAEIVPMILKSPEAVFRGLLRDEDEPHKGTAWLCYCGRPTKAFRCDGAETRPWPGQVFMVFVTCEWVVFNWYWYEADKDDPNIPYDHAVRFKERLL